MTNANVIEFEKRRKPEAVVIADTENGYTRTANDIQDRLCQLDISGSQFQVLNAIIRTTFGYNKKSDRVTNTFLVELTGISEKAVRDALITLAERQIIHCEKAGIMKIVAVNTTVSDWVLKSDKAANLRKGTEQMHRSKCTDKMEQMHQPETEQMHRTGGANAPTGRSKCTNTKDNLQKTTNQIQKDPPPPPADGPPDKPDAAIQKGKLWGTADDLSTAQQMAAVLQAALGEHYRPPPLASWANEIRLMAQQDRRQHKHMVALFTLASTDSFWKSNIQSPAALRKNWGRLAVLHSERKNGYQPRFPQNLDDQNYEGGPL